MAPESSVVKVTKMPDQLAAPVVSPMLPLLSKFQATDARWALAPVLFVSQDDWRIVMANQPCEQLFGYKYGELSAGMTVHDLVPESYRAGHHADVERFATDPHQTARPMGQGRPVMGRHRTGAEIPVTVALYPFVENGRRFVLVEIVDMRFGTAHAVPDPSWPGAAGGLPTVPPPAAAPATSPAGGDPESIV